MEYSVVIPCYNEEASIAKVLGRIPKEVKDIIVVDNGSHDKTGIIARTHGAKVVTLHPNKGYGGGIKAGIDAARGDIIIVLDGDDQYPAEKILPMARYLEKNNLDLLSGNRFPVKRSSMSITRIIGNKLLTFAANILFGLRMQDSLSGMWMFRKTILKKISLESNDMPLSSEMKINVALHPQLKFGEYAISYRPRIGESKLFPFRHGLKIFLFFLHLKRTASKKKS